MVLILAVIIINGGEVATPLSSLCVVEGSIDGLSTVSTDSLCSNLKAMTRPLDIKHSKVAFKDDETLRQ